MAKSKKQIVSEAPIEQQISSPGRVALINMLYDYRQQYPDVTANQITEVVDDYFRSFLNHQT